MCDGLMCRMKIAKRAMSNTTICIISSPPLSLHCCDRPWCLLAFQNVNPWLCSTGTYLSSPESERSAIKSARGVIFKRPATAKDQVRVPASARDGRSRSKSCLLDSVGAKTKIVTVSRSLPLPNSTPWSNRINEGCNDVVFSREVCRVPLDGGKAELRTCAFLVHTFEEKSKLWCYRTYEYLLALILGVQVYGSGWYEVFADEEFNRRICKAKGGSKQICKWMKKLTEGDIESPVTLWRTMSRALLQGRCSPFFSGCSFLLKLGGRSKSGALTMPQTCTLIKACGGVVVKSGLEENWRAGNDKGLRILIFDDDATDEFVHEELVKWEASGLLPADLDWDFGPSRPKSRTSSNNKGTTTVQFYALRSIWLTDAISFCRFPPVDCLEYTIGTLTE